MAYVLKGEIMPAIADFNKASLLDPSLYYARQNPQLPAGWLNRGIVNLYQGKTTEAEKEFAQCFILAPNLKPAITQLIEKVRALKQK
jgi:tetratricopeptide (TPR) repeat protein